MNRNPQRGLAPSWKLNINSSLPAHLLNLFSFFFISPGILSITHYSASSLSSLIAHRALLITRPTSLHPHFLLTSSVYFPKGIRILPERERHTSKSHRIPRGSRPLISSSTRHAICRYCLPFSATIEPGHPFIIDLPPPPSTSIQSPSSVATRSVQIR